MAFGVALPDAAQHVDWLCQPVRGDNAQPDRHVEEQQEVTDLRRQREVAQDEVESSVRGGVEGLPGVEGEDVVASFPLELPLRHEQGGGGIGAGEGPLLPMANHAVSRELLRDALGEGVMSSFMSRGPGALIR